MTDPEGRRSLFTPAFLLLSAFYFLVFFAGYQLFPVVPLHLKHLGAGLAESGRFMFMFTLGSAFGSLFTGPLGDRLGQRRVLRAASLAMVGFFALYAFLPVRWPFYILAPIHGLIWSGLRTSTLAKAGAMLRPEHRAEGLSFFGMASPSGVALGPLAGLLALPYLGFRCQMLLLGGIYLVLHALIKGLPRETSEAERPRTLFQPPERSVLLPVLMLFLLGISFGPIPPYSAQEAIFLRMPWTSALLTSLAAGIVGLRLILGITGMGRQPIRLLGKMVLLTSMAMSLLAFAPGGTLRHVSAGLLYGAGYGMIHTLILMVIIERSRPDHRGAGVGALFFAYDAGQATGALVIGGCMEWISHRWGLAAGYRGGWGLACLALASCMLLVNRVVRPK